MAHELISFVCTKTMPVDNISQLRKGDHIKFHRLLYTHHGIVTRVWEDKNQFEVIGMGIAMNQTPVLGLKRSIQKITNWRKIVPVIYKYVYQERLDPENTIEMIEYLLENREQIQYDLFENNCEHIARLCATGKHESQQVKRFGVGVLCTLGGIAVTAGITAGAFVIQKVTQ
ncbi:uncharacterized protein LOC133176470 [Saccostrea echinata]|uniref:uncharacterized protein LOC133176470 n=1 Tax=Saccostrea echinata TaxID=191078 RepID=UPI002A8085AA|nr:uncharacterized protein LOC133176470 [Saccostrea echinata]